MRSFFHRSKWMPGCLALTLCAASLLTTKLRADTPASPEAAKSDSKPANNDTKLTAAVLDFSAKDPGNADLGKQIGEALAAGLADAPSVKLVDRESIRHTVQEHALNLSGLVDSDKSIQIGKLVGARIIITGSAFTLGKQMTITAKIIGTETSLVDVVAVKGDVNSDLGNLTSKLSEKVATRLKDAGPKLVAAPADVDPTADLQKKLADRKRPIVAVIITEEHHAAPVTVVVVAGVRATDPPAETEMKKALIGAGFTVQDVAQNDLVKFARDWKSTDVSSWPQSLAKVDLLIAGESFSEFGGRIGNLTSCSARAEINIISRKDGKIIQADKVTARAADLSENIAAKDALEKAGHQLAIKTLEFFVSTLPPANAGK